MDDFDFGLLIYRANGKLREAERGLRNEFVFSKTVNFLFLHVQGQNWILECRVDGDDMGWRAELQ